MKAFDRQAVIDLVLEQIVKDVESSDLTAIEELLKDVPDTKLIGYLPEGLLTAS